MDCIDDKASIPSDILIYEAQCEHRGDVDVEASIQFMLKLGRDCTTEKSRFVHEIQLSAVYDPLPPALIVFPFSLDGNADLLQGGNLLTLSHQDHRFLSLFISDFKTS